ncbi:MAG: hypothetical protein GVY26_15765 [Bacteroidetes bacterium]|jgi:hypothetical protein|nr:hypothetical protein [Bacteroidota bacterium]
MYVAISISEEDVALIMGRRFQKAYPDALQSAHCPRCRKVDNATITVDQLWLNPAGDVLVEGKCEHCGGPLDKLIETGVEPRQYDQAMAIREYKIEVSKDYEVKR